MAKFVKKTAKFTTPKGTFVFPALSEPDTKYKDAGQYHCKLQMSADDAAPLIAKIDKLYEKWLAEEIVTQNENRQEKAEAANKKAKPLTKIKIAEHNMPYKNAVDRDTEEVLDDVIVFNATLTASGVYKSGKRKGQVWTNDAPRVVDAKRQTITDPVWGGSVGLLRVEATPWFSTLGFGVKFDLLAAQVTDLVTAGGRVEEDVEDQFEEQDGYVAPEKSETSTAPVANATEEADPDDEF